MATELFGRAAGPDMVKLLGQGRGGARRAHRQGARAGAGVRQGEDRAGHPLRQGASRGTPRVAEPSTQLSQNLLLPILQPLVRHFGKVLTELRPTLVEALAARCPG